MSWEKCPGKNVWGKMSWGKCLGKNKTKSDTAD